MQVKLAAAHWENHFIKKLFDSKNRPLLFLIVFSLLIRFIIAFGLGLDWYTRDSFTYFGQAKELLNGGFPLYFPNGYPLIIIAAGIFKPVLSQAAVLILLNIILSSAYVWLIYRVVRVLLPLNFLAKG